MEKKQVVMIGGGTGTHTVLKGLKQYQKQIDLTAIVTMADDGGSTGRLRDEFGFLPVGDVRMALTALAKDVDSHEELLRELFLYRFDKGEGLTGHNFGNLFLVALTDILGSEEAAISAAAKVLGVTGRVVPVTTEKVSLIAAYENGSVLSSEHDIDEPSTGESRGKIIDLTVEPATTVNPKAEAAILDADLIIIGPGDLFTSVLANCVVPGVANALRQTTATVVYVTNLMTKLGQTDNMGVAEHVQAIQRFTKRVPDVTLVNQSALPEDVLMRYAADGEYPVRLNCLSKECGEVIVADLLAKEEVVTPKGDILKRSLIRHDSRELARQLMSILNRVQNSEQ